MTDAPIRLAVWSGPRNISTALMRSWGNRADTMVYDEPFYAHYLQQTGVDHPGADEVIAHHNTDWREVIESLLAPLPDGKRIYYQKHMNKHMLSHIDMQWTQQMTNCFLIREPKEMITSFIKVVPKATIDAFGLMEQVEMFRRLKAQTGQTPIVVDSKDILQNPRKALGQWCEAIGVEFDEAMLSWEPGLRETDGVWAKHWYGNVMNSTGFAPYIPKNEDVPESLASLRQQCNELYDELYLYRIH
ncbi:MAG: hypothetical protein P9L94_07190 [Candidatus Hinthialibacter antarcticus]|nr:hypothetical protein [Candidatus Hinthialibacter antarcticus]